MPSALPARIGFLALVALMLALGYSSYVRDQAARRPTTVDGTTAVGPPLAAPKTIPAARAALQARDPRARAAAVVALRGLGDRGAVGLLLRTAADADAVVRQESLATLSTFYRVEPDHPPATDPQEPAVLRALVAGLADRVTVVRVAAAEGLGDLRDRKAVEPLIASLKDEDLRWHAAHSLAEIGGARVEGVLMDALRRRDFGVMAGAHRFYLRRRNPELEPALLDLLKASGDLAVAEAFIVEGSPRLAAAARAWASAHGFTLVTTPQGHGWQSAR